MSEGISLFATLAWGFGLAFLLGYLANKLRIPALVGYLLAGICIAPTTPGFVGDEGCCSTRSITADGLYNWLGDEFWPT